MGTDQRSKAKHYAELKEPSPQEEVGGRILGTRGVEDNRKIQPTESTKPDSQGIKETETITKPAWV